MQATLGKRGDTVNNANEAFGPLKFRDDGTFQIAVFEDLHFGENAWDSWGPQQDINSVRVMNTILDTEDPDLIVLNGDLITGNNAFLENATAYVDEIVAPLVARGLTWASTYGNHDSDFNLSRQALWARESLWPNSRTGNMVAGEDGQQQPQAGITNYYLPVYGSSCGPSCMPALILWFFDSRGGQSYQQLDADGNTVPQPCWVDESVVAWFRSTREALSAAWEGRVIPSLAFVHIPVAAAQALQVEDGVSPAFQPGVNDDVPLAAQGQGWCANGTVGCAYGGQDVPFMEALVETEGLMGVFSGHDHGDTWCYKWDGTTPSLNLPGNGLNLCFGQHTGYGGYGHWIRGSRQILVTEAQLQLPLQDLAVDTWIRTEDAGVVGSVTLNSTYGLDVYAETPNEDTFCPTCIYS
ncbi:hypothetical protein M406DRAFT_35292 [Cryphonectria parasitica EP155]|uniref:Calcineurin-like phosphoesterase domain-containing protein n=1 Tax=Cryphonectria parasitica (strain ATCC 38755 / EP155) TaxID=660469 RepID=A0A9P4YAT0_CRYP1|nr:uncharacterized protein M406DRAFT_35292 [Cryphonectria parasitica EP155]KAF3769936.1 hypothetical protein M406DRAFT_35292 [Cryphonectria parasitica EP155]